MKMRLLTQIPGMMLAVMLTLVVAPGLVFGHDDDAREQAKHRTLEGTWLNDVKIVNCSDDDVVFATFQSMTTYMRGGTLLEGGAPFFPPAVSHSAGHGIWERTSRHTFRLFFRSHFFDKDGQLVATIEVESHPKLIKGDNPETRDVVEPYYLSGDGTNRTRNFNPANGKVINVTHGCNKATSRPFFFEDLSED